MRGRASRYAAIAVIAMIVACGQDKKREPAAQNHEHEAPLAPLAARPDDSASERPVYTAEEQRRFRSQLNAGRALAAQRRWGEAVVAFDKALEVIPMDGRALSELGWAAFQAGDYDRARTATLDAVRAATGAELRAASLYNLGRVAEATGDMDEAARHYRASLALRPNETVRRRLDDVGRSVPAPAVGPSLSIGPVPDVPALCERVLAALEVATPGAQPGCIREPRQVADVELLFVGSEQKEWVHLIAKGPGGWSAKALLGTVYDPGTGGVHEELEIARFDTKRIGERKVLWVETVQARSEVDEDKGARETSRVRSLTLCSWAPDSSAFECHLQVPMEAENERVAGGKAAKRPVQGSMSRSRRRLEVDIGDSGTAKVVLVEGEKSAEIAPLLGEHTLW